MTLINIRNELSVFGDLTPGDKIQRGDSTTRVRQWWAPPTTLYVRTVGNAKSYVTWGLQNATRYMLSADTTTAAQQFQQDLTPFIKSVANTLKKAKTQPDYLSTLDILRRAREGLRTLRDTHDANNPIDQAWKASTEAVLKQFDDLDGLLDAQVRQEIDIVMDKLNEDLRIGGLPMLEDLAIRKYPDLTKDQVRQLMVRAYLNREFKRLTLQTRSNFIANVLGHLGYDNAAYMSQDKIHEVMADFITPLLSSDELKQLSVQSAKELVERKALDVRLVRAGVPLAGIENFKTLIKELRTSRKLINIDLTLKDREIADSISDLKLEKNKKSLLKAGSRKNQSAANQAMEAFLTKFKDEIKDALTWNPSQFHQHLMSPLLQDETGGNRLRPKLSSRLDEFQSGLAWLRKYQDNFVTEMIQGEDDAQEAFLEGICFGFTHRVAKKTLNEPDCPTKALQTDRIHPTDRLHQAFHGATISTETAVNLRRKLLPIKWLRQQGLKEIPSFISTKARLGEALANLVGAKEQIQKSNGGIKMYYDGHATFLRLDTNRNRYLLVEPNFGTLEFKTAKEAVIAFQELMEWCYTTGDLFIGVQLVKEDGKKVSYDLHDIPYYV